MSKSWSRLVPVCLSVFQLAGRADLPDIPCPGCGLGMDLHQPDVAHPFRLLATCGDCRCWATVEECPGASAVVAIIPEIVPLLATCQGPE